MKYIDVPTFITAFAIGLFFVYVSAPKKQTIFVYPTPDNYRDVLYKDRSGMCFSFKPIETEEPTDKRLLGMFPVQVLNKGLTDDQ
jgi:hypothetical protein